MRKRIVFLSGLFFAGMVFVGGAGAVSLVPSEKGMPDALDFGKAQYPGQSQPRWDRQQIPDMQQMPNPGMFLAYRLTCGAYGTPVEFPDDVGIINEGPGTVPAGTRLHWKMTAPSFEGQYTLQAPLAPGRMVHIPGVLGSGVAAGTPCTVRVVR